MVFLCWKLTEKLRNFISGKIFTLHANKDIQSGKHQISTKKSLKSNTVSKESKSPYILYVTQEHPRPPNYAHIGGIKTSDSMGSGEHLSNGGGISRDAAKGSRSY